MPILPYLTDIIICLDSTGEITEFNKSAEQYYGWKRAEVLGKKYIELCKKNAFSYHPFLDKQQTGTHQTSAQEFVSTIEMDSGQKHSASWKIVPLLDIKNEIVAYVSLERILLRKKIRKKRLKTLNSIWSLL